MALGLDKWKVGSGFVFNVCVICSIIIIAGDAIFQRARELIHNINLR